MCLRCGFKNELSTGSGADEPEEAGEEKPEEPEEEAVVEEEMVAVHVGQEELTITDVTDGAAPGDEEETAEEDEVSVCMK